MGLVRDVLFTVVVLLLVIILTIKFSPNPTGFTVFENDVSYFLQKENLPKTKSLYNENIEKIPSFIKTTISGEKVNMIIDDNKEGLIKIKFETKAGEIESIEHGSYDEPSLIIYSDLASLQSIKDSDKIVSAIEQALDDEKILYESVDWSTKVKTGLAGVFINIWSGFD